MKKYDLKKSLEKIKSTDWDKKFKNLNLNGFEEINKYYFNIFPYLFIHSELYFKEQFSHNLYRVRPFNEIVNRNNFSEYTYPPEKYVNNQRANIEGKPVLYTSIHPKTAALEYVINQKNNQAEDLLALSVWSLKCDRDIRVVNFLSERTTSGDTKFLGVNSDESFKKYVKKEFPNEDAGLLIKLREFYIDSFCKIGKHVFSSFLAHHFLYKAQTDILIYPSIAQKNSSLNIVFNKNFADEYLNLQRVYTIKSIRKEIEQPIIYGDVLFFKNNKFEKEMLLDNATAMTVITHLDFGDSVK